FCASRDQWGRIFGEWVPAMRLGPDSIIHHGQSWPGKDTKNRVTIVPQRVPTEEKGLLRQRKSMTYRQLPCCVS
ncbi:hypothetical protein X777_16115, partial [Ooceraea biroi]